MMPRLPVNGAARVEHAREAEVAGAAAGAAETGVAVVVAAEIEAVAAVADAAAAEGGASPWAQAQVQPFSPRDKSDSGGGA